jgi:V8-like Glu-specific endopeptidase
MIQRIVFGAAALAAAFSFSAQAEQPVARAEAKVQSVEVKKGLAHAAKLRSAHPRAHRLEAPTEAMVAERIVAPRRGQPPQVGFGRGLSASFDTWERMEDGSHVAALQISSTSAFSLRAGLRIGALPDAAKIRFQDPTGGDVFEFSGTDVNEALARNRNSGDESPQARDFWSPLVEGDTIAIEIELPAGVDPKQVSVSVPQLSHLVTSAAKDFVVPTKAAAACELDAMCSAATWGSQMNAVARMIYSVSGSTYACTGTLLADQDPAGDIPYFLSANHCINTQTVASSLTTYWFYRSSACNSGTLGVSRQLAGGAALLYNSSSTDTSFMRLNNTPPAGAVYAGWYAGTTPTVGTSATGLHHPHADLLKISNGSVSGYLNCTAPSSSGSFSCSDASAASSRFYSIAWTSGLTEPGSSGSGVFRSDGLLIGQLYGGDSSCTAPADDIYGRFDVAYNAGIRNWLTAAPSQTLSVTKAGAGVGTVSSSPGGINCGPTCSASFPGGTAVTLNAAPAAGSLFAGWSGDCTGTGSCIVAMSSARNVGATFVSGTATLTVSVTGSGTINSSPAGINCGAACAASFNIGSLVALGATPAPNMGFRGWTGACSGLAACIVTINGATSVGAAFAPMVASSVALTTSAAALQAGNATTLTATVTGASGTPTGNVTFLVDGAAIGGCAARPLVAGSSSCVTSDIPLGTHTVSAAYSGSSVYNAATSSAIPQSAATLPSSVANISTRAQALTGTDTMIVGFVIGGTAPKTVAVRARGPSLIAAGIANPITDPALQLVRSSDGAVIATNDNWATAANAAQLQASGFAPSNPLEAAVLVALPPGAYTAIVSGVGNRSGVAIAEVFEVDHPEAPLLNLSTRAQTMTREDVMIAGFVLSGPAAQTVMIRARGPSLTPLGVAGALANPTLTLVRASDNAIVAVNDDWQLAANASQISGSGFAPSQAKESAIYLTLPPGAYTAIVEGSGGTTGVAIVEIFASR